MLISITIIGNAKNLMNSLPAQLIDGAKSRAAAIPRLLQIPQAQGELVVCQASILTKSWSRVHAKLFDSCLLLYPDSNSDTPTSVFLVEDAVVKYDATDIGSMVMNSSISTPHKFTLTRPSTGRTIWVSTRDVNARDAWIAALLSTGSASVAAQ